MEALVQEEVNRINALAVLSEFEDSVKSDIVIWGYERNIARAAQGLPAIKQDFKNLVEDFWGDCIGSYGKNYEQLGADYD